MVRYGRVTSTGSARVLASAGTGEKRTGATEADAEVLSAALLQSGVTVRQQASIFERLISIWLLLPLGGGKAAS